jgi:hypothetical protein
MVQIRTAQILTFALVLTVLPASLVSAQDATKRTAKDLLSSPVKLQVDPLLIAEAAEVWALIASPNNPVWPGWDASSTPLLFYLPDQQDVLINHPRPPDGFLLYTGPISFPGGRVYVKNGPTIIQWDGQNTSKEIAGVWSLVVADTLSNLRNRVRGLLEDPRPVAEKIQALNFTDLATDPYDQLGFVVHEAFHVFQHAQAPGKGANEMLLLQYPVLSVENNVGMAQEGSALAEALRATDPAAVRRAAVRWLAVRKDRRASLPAKAVEYEDGGEFNEGLARYTEYRLLQVLEGRISGAEMSLAQGFGGYSGSELAPRREQLIERMLKHMSGAVIVNNDPYGTAPLRMRLYYSGMAVGAMLDKLSSNWKTRIFLPGTSLTTIAEEALKPTSAELADALREARSDPASAALVQSKTKLAEEGKAHTQAVLNEIERGPGVGLIVDYSGLDPSTRVAMNFTPFGITKIDEQRTIFSQIPIGVRFGQEAELSQKVPAPLLRDNGRRLVRFRLPADATRAEVEKVLASLQTRDGVVANLALDLPGVSVKASKAQIRWSGEDLIILLLKGNETK